MDRVTYDGRRSVIEIVYGVCDRTKCPALPMRVRTRKLHTQGTRICRGETNSVQDTNRTKNCRSGKCTLKLATNAFAPGTDTRHRLPRDLYKKPQHDYSIIPPTDIIPVELAAIARIANLIPIVVDDARIFQQETKHIDLRSCQYHQPY